MQIGKTQMLAPSNCEVSKILQIVKLFENASQAEKHCTDAHRNKMRPKNKVQGKFKCCCIRERELH
jgi:hypothetical protein